MKALTRMLLVWASIGLPCTAYAQSADVKYCAALADKYNDYAGHDDVSRGKSPNTANVNVAIAKCKAGDTSGIPMLEQALTNAKVTLPPRT